ncbi:AMP-binding protein [Caballeronia sp. LP006]|uniref:AMP-binding protein n=1 Tax=unclassified Caballeronia TaxID=2646786 RepID=UPI002028C9E5|nr:MULTISPECIES: AMP-binding protein [unclassified Caballeronia]MDR5800838.1 AMP-binding protein [Caballeronia sp. LZ001]MDR5829039.1 AMP-binding protein [Caballeronia sp. LP006]
MNPAEPFIEARDFLLRHRTDYDTAYREFQWPALSRFNWALDYFDPMARGNHAAALHIVNEGGGETRLSFAQMSERSARVANHLRALNVTRGERILLMLPNRVELWETMLGAMKLGAIVLPATTQLAPADLRERIALGRVQHVIVDAGETHKFEGIDVTGLRIAVGEPRDGWLAYDAAYEASPDFAADGETNASDPYLLYFTSGTTSKPKLVAHTHESYPVGHLSTMYWIGLQPGDVHWNISSPGWAKHAWSCFFAPWNAQACVFIYNFSRFDAARTLDALVQYDITTLCAPPTVWRMLVQEPLASYAVKLREIVGAGEPLNPEVVERVHTAWGVPIRDGYGQTETTAQIANTPGQRVAPGSMGRPLPGYRVALLDPDGALADEGEIALVLNPPPLGLMTGYADNPTATENAMRGGFYRTSDVASRGADGYFVYVGRADDVFKSSDYRLSPFELESVLIEHEAIAEAAVVPSPDPLRLSVPKAFVTLRHGFAVGPELARSVFAFSRERLSPYKRIRRIEFAELPKTISGKIRRVDLRRQEAARTNTAVRGEFEFWEEDFPELRQTK